MAPHLVLCRSYNDADELWKSPTRFNISRISCHSESYGWSTISLYPQQFPKKFRAEHVEHVWSTGNGLVCFSFSKDVDRDFLIWNPSTDKFQLIPRTDSRYLPCLCSSRRCVRLVVDSGSGLGLVNVAESQDYKFVRFMSNFNEVYNDGSHNCSKHVAVYSSKNNLWKEVPFPFHYGDVTAEICPRSGEVAVCVNGFLYWTTYKDVIISFDLSSDQFSTLLYPDGIVLKPLEDVFLLELDGSLGLVIKSENTELFRFWVHEFKRLSSSPWTRKVNFDVRLDAGVAKKPLWLGNKNNIESFLLLQGCDGALLEYDYSRRELKKIDQMNDHCRSEMVICPYVMTNNANIAEKKSNSTCEFGGWKAHLRPHSKCSKVDDVVMDRISQLPNNIIINILSQLPLKEYVSTSVLSTRWSDLWRHTPNLVFPNTHLTKQRKSKVFPYTHLIKQRKRKRKRHTCKYIKRVNSVVESHKASALKEFNISFPLNYSTQRRVTKWLKFAFSRRVEVFELNLFGTKFFFLEKFMRKRSILKSSNLRSLCLKCLKVSGEAIGLFLRNCPLLERLIVKYAVLTSDLEVCGSALKHLEIQGCLGGKSIKGYAPNLTCLKIDSFPFKIDIFDESNSEWVTQQSADDPPLFCFISSQLTTLEFTLRCPLRPKGFFVKGFPQMASLRELILTYLGCGYGISPITSIICAFPHLEEFEIKCFLRREHRIEHHGMDVVNNVERLCHWHLRVFKFTWFDVGDGDHIELMSYILENCVALEKIILDIYGVDLPSVVAAGEYVTQLRSKLPTHIQFIVTFNNRQVV